MTNRDTSKPVGCGVLLLAAGVVIGLFVLFAPYYSTHLWWATRQSLFWAAPLIVLFIMGFAAVRVRDDGKVDAAFGLVLLTVAGLILWVGWVFAHEYQQDRAYAATISVVDTPVPDLKQRTPFTVSAAQVRPNLGDIPGDVQQTSYLPDLGVFTTPVERRGWTTGYQTLLVQQIGDTGRNQPSKCDFAPEADRRMGGVFNHNLGRLVNSQARWVNWDDGDVFGWCDHGTPKIVVPLKEQDGLLVVTERPAGLAIYDGATGELTIHRDATGVPGPTYPLSLAATQRESVGALTGFGDWFWNRAGWELPDEADSINSSNNAEFVLATTEGEGTYVTLLTGRGSATAVSAISMVGARLGGDQLAPVVVHRTAPVWLSPTSLTERVRADFGDVFATQRDAQIFELAPLGGNRWVASIGLPQNLIYRVTGVGDLAEAPCLVSLTGERLRCGPAANVGGAGPGVALSGVPSAPGVGASAPANSDLPALSTPQLLDLINRANAEAARRLTTTGGQ